MSEQMTKRQLSAQNTRKKLIEACRGLLREKGYDQVTVDEIAARAGVAKGSFYTYFKRKEDVIEALTEADFYHLAERANAMTDIPLIERLRWYCRTFLAEIEAGGVEVVRQWIRNNVAPNPIPGRDDGLTKYQFDARAVLSILTAAQARGELRADAPMEALALLINGELYGLMTIWCMSDESLVGSAQTDSFCEILLQDALRRYAL